MSTKCLCEHPADQVTPDILNGSWKGHQIKWCRKCGAFRIRVFDPDYLHSNPDQSGQRNHLSPWEVPTNSIDPLCPTPELAGTYPVVLYFNDHKEAKEFCEAIRMEKNLKAKEL